MFCKLTKLVGLMVTLTTKNFTDNAQGTTCNI